MSTVALQTGLEIYTQKTKSMRVNTPTNTLIQIAEQNIEYVESFTYLGSIISKTGGTTRGGHQIQYWKGSTCLCHPEASLEQDQADHFQLQCEVYFVVRLRDMEVHQSTRLKTPSFCEHLPTTNPPY